LAVRSGLDDWVAVMLILYKSLLVSARETASSQNHFDIPEKFLS